jgi:Uma2 family endonuclease
MVAEIHRETNLTPRSTISEERVVLYDISWETFERLLAESGDRRTTRFHYLNGMLEIMSPMARHEGGNRFIERIINALAEELQMNIRNLGSLTLKRADLKAGAEPDSCYYIQNEPLVRSLQEINFATDPPPDLVLEVDITNPSDRRFPIYAALGIPELWKYDGQTLQYYSLQAGIYVPVDRSTTFPWLPPTIVLEFLAKRFELGETQTIRLFKTWVQENSCSSNATS